MKTLVFKFSILAIALILALTTSAKVIGALLPHGSALAYTQAMRGIVLLDTARSLSARLVRLEATLLPLHWTPDGSAVLYLKPDGDQSDVYAAGLDGSETRLTHSIRVATFSVSADGQQLAIALRRSDGTTELAVGALGTAPQGVIIGSNPTWSPDGRKLAFVSAPDGNWEIYVYNTATTAITNLSQHHMNDFEPTWSPDSRQLAFVSMRDGDRELYLVDTDSGDLRRLTHDPGEDYNLAWSPDGVRLAFVATLYGVSDLYIMNLANGDVTRLTRHGFLSQRRNFRAPTWSRDGRWLAFESTRSHVTELYLTDTATGSTRQLTFDGDNFYPVWQP